MKKLRNLIAVMVAMGMALTFTGCGDDDDDDDNGNPNPGPTIFAPDTAAELTAQNKTYTVTGLQGQQGVVTLRFPAAGSYELTQNGVTETGSIAVSPRSDNTYLVTLTPAGGQQGSRTGVVRLDFTAANAGSFTFTPTDGQADPSGAFTVTEGGNGGNNGGDNGGTNGDPDPDPDPTGADLTGRTLQINYTGGGGDRFDFTSPTQASWENGTDTATYTYDPATRRFTAILSTGSSFDAILQEGGATTVGFKENPDAATQNFPANYTLTGP